MSLGEIFERKNIYLIVPWPYCQPFLEYRDQIHLVIEDAYDKFGDSAHFVSVSLFTELTGIEPNSLTNLFAKVSSDDLIKGCGHYRVDA